MKTKIVYCHFSFRRPKDKDYGIFACALYSDTEGKNLIARKVIVDELWKNHQHITAIQAYGNALNCIWEWQSKLLIYNVTNVLLVTDNSNLVKWIENPKKNKDFRIYMQKAYKPFHSGDKELALGVGLCEPRRLEKSHKYCKDEFVENWSSFENARNQNKAKTKLNITLEGLTSIDEILNEDKPEGLDSFSIMSVSNESEV